MSEESQNQQYEVLAAEDIQYTQRLITQQREVLAAKQKWEEHLVDKYGLSNQDAITPEGYILRNHYAEENQQAEAVNPEVVNQE